MTHLYLIAVAIILLLVTRHIYQKNIELFLIMLVIINFEFFHLIKVMRFSSNLRLMIMPIILFLLVEMIMMKKKMTIGKYGGWVILFFAIIANGILVGALSGHPIILGIKIVKIYTLMLMYFFIVNHEIDIDKFINYLLILALVIAGLTFLQYLAPSYIEIFGYQGVEGTTRENRIGEGGYLITLGAVLSFSDLLKKKKQYYLYVFLFLLIHLIFVAQTRMLIAGVVSTCLLLYFIYYKFTFKAIFVLFFVMLIVSVGINFVYDDFQILEGSVNYLVNNKEVLASYEARIFDYKYYFGRLMESPVFGEGFKSMIWRGSDEFYLQSKGIHLSDIGIMDFTMKTGLVGLTWLLTGLARFVIRIVKGKELSAAGAYILLGMTTMATIDFFMIQQTIFMFALFIGLMEKESVQITPEIVGHN